MKITPKSPELIQAQLGEFRADGDLDLGQRRAIGVKAGEILMGDSGEDLVHESVDKKLQWDDAGRPYYERSPVATKVPYDKYLDFMRTESPEDRKRLRTHHEVMLKAFDHYKGIVDDLLAEVDELENVKDHPQYLGSGNHASAFWFDYGGRQLVVKRAHGHEGGRYEPIASHGESMPFAIGNKITGLQHQVAASPDNELIITELLPGKNMTQLSFSERLDIPREHLRQVIDLVLEMHQSGLHFDPKTSNIMYDHDKGFSILDYGVENKGGFGHSEADQFVEWLVPSLVPDMNSTLRYDLKQASDSRDNIAARLESQRNGMMLKRRFLSVLEEYHPEIITSLAKRQKGKDENPMTLGGVFADTEDMLVEYDPELKKWKERLVELNLTSNPSKKQQANFADGDVVDVNLVLH